MWLVVTAGFTVGEIHTNSFYLAPFAVGAAIAAVLAALGAGGLVATVAFAAAADCVSGAAAPGRDPPSPLARRRFGRGPRRWSDSTRSWSSGSPTAKASATVKIGGEVWTARAYDEDQVIDAGEQVEVVEIRGATALVS